MCVRVYVFVCACVYVCVCVFVCVCINVMCVAVRGEGERVGDY